MDTKIIIALHKPYEVPDDEVYLPLFVGAKGKESIVRLDCGLWNKDSDIDEAIERDDSLENISEKNPYFCELTALYWAWKNLDNDYIGLVHYRRHFSIKKKSYRKKYGKFASILTGTEAAALLKRADIVVPQKRKYYIESLYSHYSHTHDGSHLDITKEIISKKYPEILPYLEEAYHRTWGYMFNMFIMDRALVDEYCSFLFDVLFELEKRVDVSGLDPFSARLFGRVSEIVFNAWILKKQSEGKTVIEAKLMDMEPVNWTKKILHFLEAKFGNKKYSKSM